MTNPRLAGPVVFGIVEIRHQIFSLLEPADLRRCMRVGRLGFESAAEILYRKISYDEARLLRSDDKLRDAFYASVVEIVDCTSGKMRLSQELKEALESQESTDISYFETIFPHVVPPLRRWFPHLQQIILQDEHDPERQSFIIHCHPSPSSSPSPASGIKDDDDVGHIDYITSFQMPFYEADHPIFSVDGYTVQRRFDITSPDPVRGDHLSVTDHTYFPKALEQLPVFGDLYKKARFDQISVPLPALTNLYRQQIANGHTERLEEIKVSAPLTWDISQFVTFAGLASSSLRILNLVGPSAAGEAVLKFTDLPVLVHVIRKSLTSLTDLKIAMGGIDEAEAVCRTMLSSETLSEQGTLRRVSICTGPCSEVLFNTSRCLYPLCRLEPQLLRFSEPRDEDGVRGEFDLSHFVKWLQKQSALRRTHLSTIDFASLGIRNMDSKMLSELEFDEEGRPHTYRDSKAIAWVKASKDFGDRITTNHIPQLQLAGAEFAQACAEFSTSDSRVTGRIEETSNLIWALSRARYKAGEAERALKKMEDEVKGYLDYVTDGGAGISLPS